MRKFLLLAPLFLLAGCRYSSDNLFYYGNSAANRAQELKVLSENEFSPGTDGKFTAVVFSDRHTGSPKAEPPDEEFFSWLGGLRDSGELPAFCVSLGDSTDHGFSAEEDSYAEFMERVESEFGIKVLNAVGNHDLYNSGWDSWRTHCFPGTSFYKFVTGNGSGKVSWYVLDTGTGMLGRRQLDRFSAAARNDPNPKIVLTHYPLVTGTFLFGQQNTTERNTLISIFSECGVILYVGGHLHIYEETDLGTYTAFSIPSYMYGRKWALVAVSGNRAELEVISAD